MSKLCQLVNPVMADGGSFVSLPIQFGGKGRACGLWFTGACACVLRVHARTDGGGGGGDASSARSLTCSSAAGSDGKTLEEQRDGVGKEGCYQDAAAGLLDQWDASAWRACSPLRRRKGKWVGKKVTKESWRFFSIVRFKVHFTIQSCCNLGCG